MTMYTYTETTDIDSTKPVPVVCDGQNVLTYARVYSNRLKKIFDATLDFRYFVEYHVFDASGERLFHIKKYARRRRIWYKASDRHTNFLITYDGQFVMIPELHIHSEDGMKMELHKNIDDWSIFKIGNEEYARWNAVFDEENKQFQMTLDIVKEHPTMTVAHYIGIAQTTLFIGG